MNEDSMREAARERLAAAELAAVLDVPIAAVAVTDGVSATPRSLRSRLLVAAMLTLGLGVAGGVAWLNAIDEPAAAQQPVAFDPVRPWYEAYLPRQGTGFMVRQPQDFANIPSSRHDAVIPMTADHAAILEALPKYPRARFLTILLPPGGSLGTAQWRALGNTEHLESLCLSGRPQSLASGLRELRHAPRLRSLMIGGLQNAFDVECAEAIVELPHLRSLIIADTLTTPAALRALAGLPHLDTLLLAQTPIDERTLAAVAQLRQLRALILEPGSKRTPINSEGIRLLAKLPKLKVLDVSRSEMSDEVLRSIPIGIESLGLSRLDHVTPEGLRSLARLTNLRSLILRSAVPSQLQAIQAKLIRTLPLENVSFLVGTARLETWRALQDQPKLRGLTLMSSQSSHLPECAKIPGLERLTLICRELPTSDDMRGIAGAPKLREVRIQQKPFGTRVDHKQSRSEHIAALRTALGNKIQLVIE